jgi:DNA helicase-2/ATP-dependent DNA helicase PcrA
MQRDWSDYQRAVFEHIERSDRHLVVEAMPGSGKSTTIVEGVNRIPGKRVLMCAFNKKIQQELETRVPRDVVVRTFNAIGHAAVIQARGRVGVNADRQRDLVRAVLPDPRTLDNAVYGDVLKIVDLAMARLADTDDDFRYIMSTYDCAPVDERLEASYIEWAREVLRRSLLPAPQISFNDQIYIPAKQRLSGPKFDYVFVDEAQDCNPAQIQLIRNSLKPGGKLVAVGDRRQAIYAWRGADHGVMDRLAEEFDADVLPLSITYRCPKNVVRLVNNIVPDLEAAPTAIDGSVSVVSEAQFLNSVRPGDLVISRTNAAIARFSMALLLAGVRCQVLGKDMSKGLTRLIDKAKTPEVTDLLFTLDEYGHREAERLMTLRQEAKAEELLDQIDTIRSLSDGLETVTQLRRRIDTLFQDAPGQSAVIFSTVHKAKGLEFDRVWMFEPTFNVTTTEGENLYYVAATRAIKALHLVQISRKDNKPSKSIGKGWMDAV